MKMEIRFGNPVLFLLYRALRKNLGNASFCGAFEIQ